MSHDCVRHCKNTQLHTQTCGHHKVTANNQRSSANHHISQRTWVSQCFCPILCRSPNKSPTHYRCDGQGFCAFPCRVYHVYDPFNSAQSEQSDRPAGFLQETRGDILQARKSTQEVKEGAKTRHPNSDSWSAWSDKNEKDQAHFLKWSLHHLNARLLSQRLSNNNSMIYLFSPEV